MLPKRNRADRKTIEKVFKDGVFLASRQLNLKYFLNKKTTFPKISFIVPKTVEKKAVERNSLKRIGYLTLKKHLSMVSNSFSGAFIFKTNKKNLKTEELSKEIEFLLKKTLK